MWYTWYVIHIMRHFPVAILELFLPQDFKKKKLPFHLPHYCYCIISMFVAWERDLPRKCARCFIFSDWKRRGENDVLAQVRFDWESISQSPWASLPSCPRVYLFVQGSWFLIFNAQSTAKVISRRNRSHRITNKSLIHCSCYMPPTVWRGWGKWGWMIREGKHGKGRFFGFASSAFSVQGSEFLHTRYPFPSPAEGCSRVRTSGAIFQRTAICLINDKV